ncbi:MAG: hypothetical protein JXR68_14345 [Bacteroidales bacterium]|nr:hypothetical protein [Bacteroidales bacterium]
MSFFRKIKLVFVLILVPAIIALFFYNQTNKHIHILPNGQIITHSHPFSKDQGSKHSHSSKEFSLISHFNNISVDVFFTAIFIFAFLKILHTQKNIQTEKILNTIILLKSDRAPPLA